MNPCSKAAAGRVNGALDTGIKPDTTRNFASVSKPSYAKAPERLQYWERPNCHVGYCLKTGLICGVKQQTGERETPSLKLELSACLYRRHDFREYHKTHIL